MVLCLCGIGVVVVVRCMRDQNKTPDSAAGTELGDVASSTKKTMGRLPTMTPWRRAVMIVVFLYVDLISDIATLATYFSNSNSGGITDVLDIGPSW